MDVLFGPKRIIDSWAMWFHHCTWLGARRVTAFWRMLQGFWVRVYSSLRLTDSQQYTLILLLPLLLTPILLSLILQEESRTIRPASYP
jgi:hypothetical protein